MKKCVGCKIVGSEKASLKEYKIKKYGDAAIVNPGDELEEGYIIYYPQIKSKTPEKKAPYVSWTPKAIYEACYREIEIEEIDLINS